MDPLVVVPCPGCRVGLRFPTDRGTLVVECPECGSKFEWQPTPDPAVSAPPLQPPQPSSGGRRRRVAVGVVVAALIVAGLAIARQQRQGTRTGRSSGTFRTTPAAIARTPRWMSISYRDLVDTSVITHSRKTVGQLLSDIAGGQSSAYAGELQPFLEPYSFVCNEIVDASRPGARQLLVSAVAEYPPASAQPAWAALLREGRYQVFIGDGLARVFLQGRDPAPLLERDLGVVRHPLAAALMSSSREAITLEVYAFENDYASQTIRLDLEPLVRQVTAADLGPRKPPLPVAGLASLLAMGGTLEAAEVDPSNQLRLYARPGGRETLAESPQTIADLAVVYRAVFYNGLNPPYISLDQHEDNRRAKVNFGGLLEDTHVGSVVLEADKLFKTLSTGLDPNSRAHVVASIKAVVPGFLTEDERGLRDVAVAARENIRYWFYPDRIRTVTDGSIAAVESCQFFADAERMGDKRPLGAAQRETMAHLNANFEEYAKRFPPFKELLTVGRLMAIVNWLHSSSAAARVDLDGLLGVELPAFETQRATQKMLAISAVASGGDGPFPERGEVTVIRLDSLLESQAPQTTDDEFLALAAAAFNLRDRENLLPARIAAARQAHDAADQALKSKKSDLDRLGRRIDVERIGLDRTDEASVDAFNALVSRYEALRRAYNSEVEAFNEEGERLNAISTSVRTIVSVGGGINLEPHNFAPPVVAPQSPRIAAVRRAAAEVSPSGSFLVRSAGAPEVPARVVDARWKPAALPTAAAGRAGETIHRVRSSGYFVDAIVRPSGQPSTLATSQYPTEVIIQGTVEAGRTVLLRRGPPIQPSPERPVWTQR